MAMYKNNTDQKVVVFAWDSANQTAKSGDAANITARISKDGGAYVAANDETPEELDSDGMYLFTLTQDETNCDLFVLHATSTTANVIIDPVVIYTLPGSNSGVSTAELTRKWLRSNR